jgi:hypothetical protein
MTPHGVRSHARDSSTDQDTPMSSQFNAKSAAIGPAGGRRLTFALAIGAIVVATASSAFATGADPADPAARTARVGYRPTIAPYTPLRPATPAPWRERNERVAPRPKTEPEPR